MGGAGSAGSASSTGHTSSANTVVLLVATVITALYVLRQFMALLLSVLALGVLYYAWKRSRKVSEPFIDIFRINNVVNEATVPCDVYYTTNVKECDAGMYFQTPKEIEQKLRSPYLTASERESLLKVKGDMDQKRLPFAHMCKTRFGTWKQLKSAPPKNATTAGGAHGAPSTYAHCFHDKGTGWLRNFRINKTAFTVNGKDHRRLDFKTLNFQQLKPDFCSQYAMPAGDARHLTTFHRKWLFGLKVNPADGTILDVQSLAVNDQSIVPYSTAYQAGKTVFPMRVERNNIAIGYNPHTYTVLRIFRNHCGRVERSTSSSMVFNNIIPTASQVVMNSAQIANGNGIGAQEIIDGV